MCSAASYKCLFLFSGRLSEEKVLFVFGYAEKKKHGWYPEVDNFVNCLCLYTVKNDLCSMTTLYFSNFRKYFQLKSQKKKVYTLSKCFRHVSLCGCASKAISDLMKFKRKKNNKSDMLWVGNGLTWV